MEDFFEISPDEIAALKMVREADVSVFDYDPVNDRIQEPVVEEQTYPIDIATQRDMARARKISCLVDGTEADPLFN
jgi:hypothetical protein